jgi:hypothetical protein
MSEFEGTSEAIILVKASPQIGRRHGETVCCAGINDKGEWVRLYPVSFRTLDQARQFRRWDRIRFRSKKPQDDTRPESLRVDHQSIEIIGELKPKERLNFLARLEVSSINAVKAEGKTLALLRPKNLKFLIERKSTEALQEEKAKFQRLRRKPISSTRRRLFLTNRAPMPSSTATRPTTANARAPARTGRPMPRSIIGSITMGKERH